MAKRALFAISFIALLLALTIATVLIFGSDTKEIPPPTSKPPPSPVTIAAVGDALLGIYVITADGRIGMQNPFWNVANILSKADIAFCNLECPLSTRGTRTSLKPPSARSEYLFRGSPSRSNELASGGIDVVSLANNHMMDFGPLALNDTIYALDSVEVKHSGAGANIRLARTPAIVETNGRRVAFLSYVWAETLPGTKGFAADKMNPGCAFLYAGQGHRMQKGSAEILRSDVENAGRMADLVIVSMHWGIEKKHRPLPEHRQAAHLAILAGADAVLGHHPHVLQGIEVYKGRPIAYSLGNFIFPSRRSANNDSCILLLELGGDAQKLELIPVRISNGIPNIAYGRTAIRIGRLAMNLSSELGTSGSLSRDGRLTIHLPKEEDYE